MSTCPSHAPHIARITYASVAGSLAMAIALVAVHVVFDSQLALAQAADSISDMFGGGVLAWAVREAAQPADADHPLGHGRAEPLAALLIAVLANVLAIEVLRTAIGALVAGTQVQLEWPVAAAFVAKVAFKGGIVAVATRALARSGNPALEALRMDARNDVLLSSVALLGFALARWGYPAVDAWLAIPIALYVGLSGVRLARANVGLVMSAAAPSERTDALTRMAASVEGVLGIDSLIATWAGPLLHVYVEIAVDGATPVSAAHDVAHAVEARLAGEEDVARVVVHVGPLSDREPERRGLGG